MSSECSMPLARVKERGLLLPKQYSIFFKGNYKAMIKLRALKEAHKIEKYLSGRVASPIKVL